MAAVLWILLAYGSYWIGWQIQLQDPDPGLSNALQKKCYKWQHIAVFIYLLLFQTFAVSGQEDPLMFLLQAYLLSALLLAAWIDQYIQLIPDAVYIPGFAGGILWLAFCPEKGIINSVIAFIVLQFLIFRHLYGGSDCLAYILCAVYLAGRGYGLLGYLLFMLLTVGIEAMDQIRKKNIAKGRLKQPVALIPYMALSLLLWEMFQ